MIDLFAVAGEASGDLQGSKLIQELLKIDPSLRIGAVAGPRMRALPIQTFFKMESLQVMGFIDVFLALPKILKQFFTIRNKILELNPKVVVCIDYPGFNLRLERSLRKRGYQGKLVHYICPTVWAWGKKRIPLMAENLDLLLTLFPFEKDCFAKTDLPVVHVGHPLVKEIEDKKEKREKIIAIFPGSRKKEIERNLPLQWKTAKKFNDYRVVISLAHLDLEEEIRKIVGDVELSPPEENYLLMQKCSLAIATSGTVTLELALHGTPTVVTYAIRPLDCWIAGKILKIDLPFYALPNIVLGKEVFAELFGPHLNEENLLFETKKLIETEARKKCLEGCKEIRKILGEKQASEEAAREVCRFLTPFHLE